MSISDKVPWRWLETWTATLFMVAGVLFFAFGAMWGIEVFMDRAAPKNIFGPAGFALAFVGMLGLYPSLVEQSRRLIGFGAIVAIVGVVGAAGNSAWYIGWWVLPSLVPDPATATVVGAMVGGMLLGQFLGYTSFGVAILRVDVRSRTVGLLLVAIPIVLAVMSITVATGLASSGSATILGGVQGLLHLAIGYILQTEDIPIEPADPSIEPTAE